MTTVDHAELKRVAEGATPGPWGTYTEKAPVDGIAARAVGVESLGGVQGGIARAIRPRDAAFIAAANPAVVLELLSEIEGLKQHRDRLAKTAQSRLDDWREAQRETDALRTQAPDSWRLIETAPKDGTNFDSQDRTNYGKRVFTKTHWYVHPSVQGWVTDEIDCCDYEFEPTHWRPSALRPQTAESGK